MSEALSLAGGRAAAMAACTCKAWKAAADDPRVWRAACTRDHGAALHETAPFTFDDADDDAARRRLQERRHWRDEYASRERAQRNWDEVRLYKLNPVVDP